MAYSAQTRLPSGETLSRNFTLRKYGEEAFGLAVEQRQRQLTQVKGVVLLSDEARKLITDAPASVSPDVLRPPPKRPPPRRTKRLPLDPAAEARIAAEILRKCGRTGRYKVGATEARYIARVSIGKPNALDGWRVSLFQNKRRVVGKVFFDATYGCAAKSFEQARKFRDRRAKKLGLV